MRELCLKVVIETGIRLVVAGHIAIISVFHHYMGAPLVVGQVAIVCTFKNNLVAGFCKLTYLELRVIEAFVFSGHRQFCIRFILLKTLFPCFDFWNGREGSYLVVY